MVIDKITIGPGTGLIVGSITSTIIEKGEIILAIEITEIIGPIIEIIVGLATETIIEMDIGTITDQTTEGDSSNQRHRNRNVSQDHGRSRESDRSSSRESSQSRSGGGNQNNRDQSRNGDRRESRNSTRDRESRARSKSRSTSSSHVSTNRDRHRCYRCNEYDHFARECSNIGTDGSSDDMGMLDQNETYALNYAEGEDFDMHLNM